MKKIFLLFSLIAILYIFESCTKDSNTTNQNYAFTKPYCATITVGGVVGISEKCYQIGDIVTGKENTSGKLTIRIADHSALNDGPVTSASYQEFLDVPLDYLAITK
jgi:hypothetical protein